MDYIVVYEYDKRCYPVVLYLNQEDYSNMLYKYNITGEIRHVDNYKGIDEDIKPVKITFAKVEQSFTKEGDQK